MAHYRPKSDRLPQVLSESAPQGYGTNTYLYGLGRIAQQNAGGSEYFLADALGSVRQLVDASGTIAGTQSFDPYGNLLDSSSTLTSYGFAGEWTDGTDLQYLRARYYSPDQGSFITKDPFSGVLAQPTSLTPYQYAFNNPVLRTDPSGEFVDTLFDIASVGYDLYTIVNKNNHGCAVSWSDWAALGLDALGLAIPFIPAVGGVVFRAAAHGDEVWDALRAIEGFDRYADDVARFVSHSDDTDIVYRVMRSEQHPASLVEGIWARNPLKDYEAQYHVMQGNKRATNWISTTRDIDWARKYVTPENPIYAIDLNKVTTTIVDTTKPSSMKGWFYQAKVLAGRASEVLVDKYIPADAILGILK